ncbi:MAG: hypothetical protein BWX65_00739 [Bacteroidetes bacterium ADurb.Bin057]|nr:MAG: hypothetical protein BWX65_00739 [Bacteroidetes bacterium ADurb.Bin057]
MENCFYITIGAGFFNAVVNVLFYLWINFKIVINQLLSFFSRNKQSLRQTKCRNTVNNTKISRFSFATHVGSNFIERNFINFSSSSSVNVIIVMKSRQHISIATQVRHNTQFHLRIVGTHKQATLVGNKCFTNFFALLVSNWNILQIRIAGTQATCSRNCLIK